MAVRDFKNDDGFFLWLIRKSGSTNYTPDVLDWLRKMYESEKAILNLGLSLATDSSLDTEETAQV